MTKRASRRWLWLLVPLFTITGLGLNILKIAWQDGPPLWWVLRGSRVEKVVVRWDKQKVEIVDAEQVQQFYQAVLSGSAPLPYATKCLPEKPEDWSITLIRAWQSPFQVQVGIDTCGTFYIPEVGSTYHSIRLMRLIHTTLPAK